MKMQRVRQFFQAIFAHFDEADRRYVAWWLPEAELQQLFYGMALPDQVHALRTAYTAEKLLEEVAVEEKKCVARRLLLRCALLHDVGRARGTLGTLGKTAVVLLHHFFPRWAKTRGEFPRGGKLSAMLYVYFHHPQIGAAWLQQFGYEAEAAIVARHHEPPAPGDSAELDLLRQADALN